MPRPRIEAHKPALLSGLLLLASCSSTFNLQLPIEHPARPQAVTTAPLQAPSPFDVQPAIEPKAELGSMPEMDGMHMREQPAPAMPGDMGHGMNHDGGH